ncbi:hypothetical protein AB0442_22990 [Kitasatospora sp. NPDC085895]|uniref:hypothetical protein n=1 Tax=Kitasatospora sp. NPDC085895 TaxID=3155057 RepID=UPI00344CD195
MAARGPWLALRVGDRFDRLPWRDTFAQAPALGELAEDLRERYDYTEDLLQDAFLAAYKVKPELRDQADMAASRLVNHQVVTAMMAFPEFAELRRETVGDPFAAAMAVLAVAGQLRELLERTKQARDRAEQAENAQREAAKAVQRAIRLSEAADLAVDQAVEEARDCLALPAPVASPAAG